MIINLSKIDFAGGGSGGGSLSEQEEYVIARALNDLNDRLTEVENNNNENQGE